MNKSTETYGITALKHQFYLGEWLVDASSNTLTLGKSKRTIEPKAMDVLLLLCQHTGEVVSADDIVAQCWPNAPVGDNPVHKTITHLRRALGDKANAPVYIETIRKRGYRVIANVEFMTDEHTRANQTQWKGDSPFPGLKAFSREQSDVYFGRTTLVRQLLERITDQFVRKRPFTLVIGPSGSGKSSLVHAGLLPKLLNTKSGSGIRAVDYFSVDMSDISPNKLPEELAANLLDLDIDDTPLFEGESTNSLLTRLLNNPQSVIELAKQQLANNNTLKNTLYPCFPIVIDRLEVYLSSNEVSQEQKAMLFSLLEQLAQSNLFLVLLVTRNDFYPFVANYPALMQGKERGTHFDIAPPTVAELSQMIRLPAIAAGLTWEVDTQSSNALDDIILADAAKEPNCLPLLQYTLQELYLQRNNELLQMHTYEKLGGIDGAIGHKAEQLYLQLPSKVQNKLEKILPLIVTITDDGANLTSKTAPWSALSDENETAFVQQMVESRLFVSHLYQDTPCFKVAHEAVLRRWPRVQLWMQQHQSALVSKKRVAEQTVLWLQDNRSPSFLLAEGKPLTDALSLMNDESVRLNPNEHALIRASQKKQRTKRMFKGATVTLLVCLTMLSFAAMLQSQHSQHLAERKRVEAENLMGFMIGDFADKLRSVKRMDLLEGISEQALAYVEAAQQESDTGWLTSAPPEPSFELRFQHALSLQATAEVRYYRDDVETAKQLYEEADKRLSDLLKEQPNNFELLKAAGANAFWLGEISFWADNFALADTQFKHYLSLSKKMLVLAPNDVDALLELSYATNSIGSVAFRQLDFDKALSFFELSLEYKKRIFINSSSSSYEVTAIADTYSWIASTLINKGNINEALITLENAERLLDKQLPSSLGNADIIETLSFVKVRLAENRQLIGNIELSEKDLEEAQKLVVQILAQDPENSTWKSHFLHIRTLLNYYKSMKVSSSLANSSNNSITIDEMISEEPTLPTRIYATHYFQNRGEWNESDTLLKLLDKKYSLSDKLINVIHAQTINTDELINHILFLLAIVRQSLQDNGGNIHTIVNQCESLFKLTNKVILKSRHPLLFQAHVFAGYCLNKQKVVAEQHRQLTLMKVPLPHYFTIINKELINDTNNTTQL